MMSSVITHNCFISQPNKYHKFLLEQIRLYKNFYIYHETWALETVLQYKSANNLWNLKPFAYPMFKTSQNIFGAFPCNRFDYLKNINKYTIIENPVDRVYQCYSYYEAQLKINGSVNQMVFSNASLTLDSFIDMFIETPANVRYYIKHKDVTYKTHLCTLNQFANFDTFAFIGTVEKMHKSLNAINDFLHTNIKFVPKMNSFYPAYHKHRRVELEQALHDQLVQYFNVNDNL